MLTLPAAVQTHSSATNVKTSKFPWINTWGVEYYNADAATAALDATYFDLHLSPNNVTGVKTNSPNSLAVLYNIWREQYANDEPGAVLERKKIGIWCAANAKNPENFYCHYAKDVTISSDNLSTGLTDYIPVPGWNPANDANNDGIRDYPADRGISSSVGSGFLADSSKNWSANQWSNAVLVDRTGEIFAITGNSTNQIFVSGAPRSGRYGISSKQSADHYATALKPADARVKTFIWENYAYAMNVGDPDYIAYRSFDARKVIVDGDKQWDPNANSLYDGLMIDNTSPEFPWPHIVDGEEIIIEYPVKSKYRSDQATLFAAVKTAVGPSKYIWGNTGSYDYNEVAEAGGGQHQEQFVAVVNEHGPVQWEHWKIQSQKGIYCLVLPSWDCWDTENDRERMHYLAFHYVGGQPYIYLGFRGFGYINVYHWAPNPYDWFKAVEANVGTPVEDTYSALKTGTDPAGQSYTIYKREYTNALVLCRPKLSWSHGNYGGTTAVTVELPYYTTASGQSNQYKPLKVDGTFGTPVSSVSMRNVESYILFKSAPASPPPDTTKPVISGVTTSGITTGGAIISWTTDEPAKCGVEYGTNTSYGATAVCSSSSTGHSVTLSNLALATVYHYRIKCTDTAGNTSITSDYTFTTSQAADQNPPIITAVNSATLDSTSIVVTWTTDEPSDSRVEYSPTSVFNASVYSAAMLTSHKMYLNRLVPGTTYYLRIKSRDKIGNLAVGSVFKVTMPKTAPFLREWLVVGPFDSAARKGYSTNYINEAYVMPTSGTVSGGRTWISHSSPSDLIDFNRIFTKNDWVVAYAHLYVYTPVTRLCQLRLGSDDGIKVWLNGKNVLSSFAEGSANKDARTLKITLRAGWNRLLVKVDETDGAWGFYARICDSYGNNIPSLKYSRMKP